MVKIKDSRVVGFSICVIGLRGYWQPVGRAWNVRVRGIKGGAEVLGKKREIILEKSSEEFVHGEREGSHVSMFLDAFWAVELLSVVLGMWVQQLKDS